MLLKLSAVFNKNVLTGLLCAIFLISGGRALAQVASGTVIADSIRLSGALIRNKTNKSLAVSNLRGEFQLAAVYRDTLVATFVGYLPDTIIFKSQPYLLLQLKRDFKTLREVVITDKRITPLRQYLKNQDDFKQIYRIGDDSHMFFARGALGLVGVGVSIDALYSLLSKEGKDARRLQRTLTADYHAGIVDSRFTKDQVSRVTGYTEKQLDEFMLENRPSYEFVERASDYEIISYIKRRVNHILSPADNPTAKTTGKGLNIKFKTPTTADVSTNTSRLGAAAGQGRP